MEYDNRTLKKHLELRKYPYPIANSAKMIMSAIEWKGDAFQLYSHLKDAYEHSLRFLTILFLADMKSDLTKQAHVQEIIGLIISIPVHTLGNWQSIFRRTMKYTGNTSHDPSLQEIVANKNEIMKIYDTFINQRNGQAHGTTPPQPVVLDMFHAGLQNYFRLIELLKPLEQIHFYIFKERYEDAIEVYDCTGYNNRFDKIELPNGTEYDDLITLEAFIATPDNPVLPLRLLAIYLVGIHNHDYNLYLFDKAEANTYVALDAINDHSTLHLTPTEVLVKIKDFTDNETGNHSMAKILSLGKLTSFKPPNSDIYLKILGKYQDDYNFTPGGIDVFNPFGYYYDTQKQIIKHHAAIFVGRQDIVGDIQVFIKNTPKGYLLIEGEPGQGKTSLMSFLVHQRRYIHHFISKEDGRNSIEGIYRSLCQQLKNKYKLNIDLSDFSILSKAELSRNFSNMLIAAAEKTGNKKLVLCLDALDELEDRNALDFLPSSLPANVLIIVSTRPVNLRPKENTRKYTLQPLSFDDFLQILQNREIDLSEPEQRMVYERCAGNALFIKHTLDALQEGTITINQLPSKIELFYEKILDDALDKGIFYNEIKGIIGILCISKGGFNDSELSRILGIRREILYGALSRIRQYLVCDDEGRYRLYHKLMPDYFLGEKSYSLKFNEIQKLHGALIDFCEPIEVTYNKYGLQNLPYHYFEMGNVEGLVDLFNRLNESAYPAVYSWLGLFSSYKDPSDRRMGYYQKLKDIIMHGSSIKAQRIFATHLYYIAEFKQASAFLETVLLSGEALSEEDKQGLTLQLAWSYYEMADFAKMLPLIHSIPKETIIEPLRDAFDDLESNVCFNIGELAKAVKIHEGIEARCKEEGREFPYYSGLGQAYWLMGRNDDALRCHFASLRMNQANFDKVSQAKDHGNIGLVKYFLGEVGEGLQEQEKACELFEQYNFSSGCSMFYRNMGCVSLLAGNINDAEDYFHKGQVIDEQNFQNYGLVDYYNNIGVIHMKRGAYQAAIENFKKSYQMDEDITVVIDGVKLRTNTGGANSANCNLALTSLILYGDLDQANTVLLQELQEFTNMSSLEEQIYCCVNLALVAYFQKNADTAANYLKDAYERARSSRSKWLNGLALTRVCQLYKITRDEQGLQQTQTELAKFQFSPHPSNPLFSDCVWTLENLDRLVVPFQRCIEYY